MIYMLSLWLTEVFIPLLCGIHFLVLWTDHNTFREGWYVSPPSQKIIPMRNKNHIIIRYFKKKITKISRWILQVQNICFLHHSGQLNFLYNISSCQSYNDTCPFFWHYDLWVSVTLIVNGVSPYISHITKYTGLRQFQKCYNVISPMFLFNCPNFDLWYLHFYKIGHVSLKDWHEDLAT